jgi:DNA polymerase III delta subunit
MIKLNLSEQSTNHLIDMYEARIDALQNNIEKLKLIIKNEN